MQAPYPCWAAPSRPISSLAGPITATSSAAAMRLSRPAASRSEPLEVGQQLAIGGQLGIIRTIEPLLGEPELRVVVQLLGLRH
jgi:hypothetical protein